MGEFLRRVGYLLNRRRLDRELARRGAGPGEDADADVDQRA